MFFIYLISQVHLFLNWVCVWTVFCCHISNKHISAVSIQQYFIMQKFKNSKLLRNLALFFIYLALFFFLFSFELSFSWKFSQFSAVTFFFIWLTSEPLLKKSHSELNFDLTSPFCCISCQNSLRNSLSLSLYLSFSISLWAWAIVEETKMFIPIQS